MLAGGAGMFNVASPYGQEFIDDWSYELAFDVNSVPKNVRILA
jgi:hypothetical protein